MSGSALPRSVTAAPAPGGATSVRGSAAQLQAPAGMLLLVLIAVLVGVTLSIAFGSPPRTRRRSSKTSPLLPRQRSWGVSRHQRLQDPGYLRRILEAEHAASSPQGKGDSGSTAAPLSVPPVDRADTSAEPTERELP